MIVASFLEVLAGAFVVWGLILLTSGEPTIPLILIIVGLLVHILDGYLTRWR